MSFETPSSPSRRSVLITSMAAGVAGLLFARPTLAADEVLEDPAIRPFSVHVPEADITDLRQRILGTRWPDRETVNDPSQGVQLAKLKSLMEYWGTSYNWRKAEAKLNALPQFITTIDGVDIHFIHIRSKHPSALPVIISHGWPGSVIEQLKVIGPLTDPTAHGGRAEDAFDVVIPSLPGYGFSGRPTGTGWDPHRIARAWGVLMKRPGHAPYVALWAGGGGLGRPDHRREGAPDGIGLARNPHQPAGDCAARGRSVARRRAGP